MRIICLDETGAVLLLRWRDPVDGRTFWEPPGGGIEPGEDSRQAAKRELHEETGLEAELEASSIRLRRDFTWAGRRSRHLEEFYWARAPVKPTGLCSPTPAELETFVEWSFVGLDDFSRLTDPVEPPELAVVVRRLVKP